MTNRLKGRAKSSMFPIAHFCFPTPKSLPAHYPWVKLENQPHVLTTPHATLPGRPTVPNMLRLRPSSSRVREASLEWWHTEAAGTACPSVPSHLPHHPAPTPEDYGSEEAHLYLFFVIYYEPGTKVQRNTTSSFSS